ncbi:aldehyde dehydrogenase family protein [Mycolicibacterium sp. 141076]|uniref:aldehyde dehydrogenase family protein n=1 Tax=unclassified Mycolicibacterium TaxID=2636767 RepID=UPI001FD3CD1E|nr:MULTISPECIES: aldehyde dehydrogenase family protein [unclassified Mycolicibacterium]MDX1876883.1 aldehyde dehydrogenase family protein [Mycolicibacterium sp. 141076]
MTSATATITVCSPADGRVIDSIPAMSVEAVAAVIADLRVEQAGWAGLSPRARAAHLLKYRDWLLDNECRLAVMLQRETGKPWAEANLEIPYIVDAINYYARTAPGLLADRTPPRHGMIAATKRQLLVQRPYPVVGVITPWNFPLGLSLLDAVPALLAGAAVVVKPSEFTPLTVAAAVDGWKAVGAPRVLECVTGGGETGAAVVDNVDYIQFTGSTRTGKTIAHAAAERLIPCGLELGGKDAMIVLDDADVARAANAAVWGGMANSGQMCTSVERVYVQAGVYDEFVGLVVEKLKALRVGEDDQQFRYDVGPLATEAQLAIVQQHVDDAVARGATVLTGGARVESTGFFEPTVLVEVDHSMLCMQRETFGPTLPIMKVRDEDEAVRLANHSDYGLSATVFCGNRTRAERVACRLDVGAVNINDVFGNLFTLSLPQGGWKQSGLGRRNGADAVLKYARPQAIVSARVQPDSEFIWYPYTAIRGAIVHRVGRLLGARDLLRRLG